MPIFFSNWISNCSNLLDLRNLQEQVKKAFCYQKLFWPFTVWINCSSDCKNFANSQLSASNFKSFFQSLEQFFLTVGQNNFGNKTPLNVQLYCLKNYSKNLFLVTFLQTRNLLLNLQICCLKHYSLNAEVIQNTIYMCKI